MVSLHFIRRRKVVEDEEQQASVNFMHSNSIGRMFTKTLSVSLALMALSAGLSSRFDAHTPLATVLGLQILFSAGAGLGAYQVGFFGLRWTTTNKDTIELEILQIISTLAVFSEMIGGSLGITVGQTALISQLSKQIPEHGADMSLIWMGGPTNSRDKLTGDVLEQALNIWNGALTSSFYVSAAAGAFALAVVLAMYVRTWTRLITRQAVETYVWLRASRF
jgi:hypothetical protein